jgi:N-acetylmuramoyl-L-alanine amidase
MALKIMIDAGHYGKYNQSPANSKYYESEQMWTLANLLKEELSKKSNVVVGVTRTD